MIHHICNESLLHMKEEETAAISINLSKEVKFKPEINLTMVVPFHAHSASLGHGMRHLFRESRTLTNSEDLQNKKTRRKNLNHGVFLEGQTFKLFKEHS